MTTTESVIGTALRHKKYDNLHCTKPNNGFLSASDIKEPLRIKLERLRAAPFNSVPWGHTTTSFDAQQQGSSSSGTKQLFDDGTTFSGGMEVTSVVARVELYAFGERLGIPLWTSHAPVRGDPAKLRNSGLATGSNGNIDSLIKVEWEDEWLFFPISLADVPLDAIICFTLYGIEGILGGTSFHVFSSRGELKVGNRRYKLHYGKEGDGRDESTTLGHTETEPCARLWRDYQLGRIPTVPWLDEMTKTRLGDRPFTSCGDLIPHEDLIVEVCFPVVQRSQLPVFKLTGPTSTFDFSSNNRGTECMTSPFSPYVDYDVREENLAESKSATLSKSLHLIADADAQPGYKQRKQITSIINLPPIRTEAIRADDASLLWRFRYFLLKDPKGFVPFMQCVDWANIAERTEAEKLIPIWKPISPEDALVCLSNLFEDVSAVRRHAVDILSKESNERLTLYLLQLVQAVRYDGESELAHFLVERAVNCWELCSGLYWFVSVEAELEKERTDTSNVKHWEGDAVEGLKYTRLKEYILDELTERKRQYRYRLGKQDQLRAMLLNMFSSIFKSSKDRLKQMDTAVKLINERQVGIKEIFDPNSSQGGVVFLPSHPRVAVDNVTSEGLYMFKSAKRPLKLSFVHVDGHPVEPSDTAAMNSSLSSTASTSNSTATTREGTEPLSLPRMDNSLLNNASINQTHSENVPLARTNFPIIFKCGDDVRQDQLVIQVINLMDSLLKENGLDLCLTPYRVLATSANDGFVELVPDVETFQEVQKEGVVKYLGHFNKTPEQLKKAMDKFVKSCAGYCIITFLLGIGDRHLENLLITRDGCLLHIDFGFILGHDPKPFPPPMKINKEMVDAIGGVQSEGFAQFKMYACSAFNILRKHATLILSLLMLMVDASIPQISDGKVDPKIVLMKVQDKLRVDLSDAEAMWYIQTVIADSVGAVFTNLWDILHEKIQAVRN